MDRPADSVLHGGPLSDPPVTDLAGALERAARLDGAGDIVYLDDTGTPHTLSYPDLLDDAARILTALRERGLRPGDRVVMQITDEPDLLAAFWACQLGGFVPVPVTTNPPP